MPRAKKIEATSTGPAVLKGVTTENSQTIITETSAPEPAFLSGDVEKINIFNGEQFIRQYSRQVHGDNFAELADSYIAGHPHCHKE